MRVVCIYKDDTEYTRDIREWLENFRRHTGKEIEALDPELREGEIFVQAHDILEYPAIVAMNDDGQVLQQWIGKNLPTIDEVNFYLLNR